MIMQVAAKAVIIDDRSRILLVRKSLEYKDGPNAGKFDFPGGRVEVGETYQQALVRESKEEVSLEVEPLHPIYVDEWRPIIRGQPYQIIGVFSLCKAKNYNVELDSENDKYEWVSLSNGTKLDLMEPAARLVNLLRDKPDLLLV